MTMRDIRFDDLDALRAEISEQFGPWGSELEVTQARLGLCAGVRDVIAQGLGLLGVSAPEQM